MIKKNVCINVFVPELNPLLIFFPLPLNVVQYKYLLLIISFYLLTMYIDITGHSNEINYRNKREQNMIIFCVIIINRSQGCHEFQLVYTCIQYSFHLHSIL